MGQPKKWARGSGAMWWLPAEMCGGSWSCVVAPTGLGAKLGAMFGRVIGWALKFRATRLEQRGLGYGSKDDGIKLFAHTFIHATTRLSAGRQMP